MEKSDSLQSSTAHPLEIEKVISTNLINNEQQFLDIRDSLINLDAEAFEGKTAIAGHWRGARFNSEDILVVLRRDAEHVIGYILANPSEKKEGKTAHVHSTVIAPEYRGRGLSDQLEDALEAELHRRRYEYLTRDSVKKNSYADHIMKRYGDRVVHSMDYSAALGPAREITIRL